MGNRETIILLVLSGALAWLVIIGSTNSWGYLAAGIIIMLALIQPLLQKNIQRKNKSIRTQYNLPLLGFVFLAVMGLILVIRERVSCFTPAYALFALGGVLGITNWIARKEYRKPIKQLWKEDLYILAWPAEVVVILIFIIDIIRGHESFTISSMMIMLLALLDVANQFVMIIACRNERE